ncbi:MAG: DUF2085 domain-containing protein [Candidatus Anstonellales archaeon]
MDFFKIYTIFIFILLISAFLTPFFAFYGYKGIASFFYNAFALTCHQYPYRSLALFPLDNSINNCITKEGLPVFTMYTKIFAKDYNGPFYFNRSEIGLIRAEICTKIKEETGDILIGYKFPVCARDLGIFMGMALTTLAFRRGGENKDEIRMAYIILLIIPLAIDGSGQFLGFWESTNDIRIITGLLFGAGITLLFAKTLNW